METVLSVVKVVPWGSIVALVFKIADLVDTLRYTQRECCLLSNSIILIKLLVERNFKIQASYSDGEGPCLDHSKELYDALKAAEDLIEKYKKNPISARLFAVSWKNDFNAINEHLKRQMQNFGIDLKIDILSSVMILQGSCNIRFSAIDTKLNMVVDAVSGKKRNDLLSQDFNGFQGLPDDLIDHLIQRHVVREDLMKKIEDTFSVNKNKRKRQTLCGQTGMGKTQLAFQYFHSSNYEVKIWFDASNQDQLIEQYIKLGKKNNLKLHDWEGKRDHAYTVRDWLGQLPNCLVVYDNMPDDSVNTALAPGNVHILETTRYSTNKSHYIEIGVMTENEGLALLKKTVPAINHPTEAQLSSMKKLLAQLGYHPQAIVQAGNWMNQKNNSLETCSYSNREGMLRLLNCKVKDSKAIDWRFRKEITDSSKESMEVVNKTSLMSSYQSDVTALQTHSSEGEKLLQQCSFLEALKIPEELLNHLEPLNKIDWSEVWDELSRYSFMHDDGGGTISMHPLLQLSVRESLLEDRRFQLELIEGLNIGMGEMREMKEINSEHHSQYIESCKQLLPHAERLNKHAVSLAKKLGEAVMEISWELEAMPVCLSDLYFDIALYEKKYWSYSVKCAVQLNVMLNLLILRNRTIQRIKKEATTNKNSELTGYVKKGKDETEALAKSSLVNVSMFRGKDEERNEDECKRDTRIVSGEKQSMPPPRLCERSEAIHF